HKITKKSSRLLPANPFKLTLIVNCHWAAREMQSREAANSTLDYMTKSSLANSIRIVFASLFLCLFGALPAFATDGIYTKFGLDLGYAGRIGYPGPEWAIYVYGAGTSSSRFN